jgi:hypothetical protein
MPVQAKDFLPQPPNNNVANDIFQKNHSSVLNFFSTVVYSQFLYWKFFLRGVYLLVFKSLTYKFWP